MRLLIDAQLPPALCAWFRERDLVATHVTDALGGQTPDRVIARHAEEHEMVLVTKDDDFLARHPPIRSRLIWLRCGNISNQGLRIWLAARLARDRGTAAAGRAGGRGAVMRSPSRATRWW